jgi:predicted acetyltransferase
MSTNKDQIKLIEPTIDLKTEFLALVKEHQQADDNYFEPDFAQEDFREYIRDLAKESQGIDLPPGIVPMTTFWMVTLGDRILGISVLRHHLTPALEHHGGHIGYIIRPSQRRKGYGSIILALTLEKANVKGIRRVRITCDASNTASVRIIEKNGGILSGQVESKSTGKWISQYWINL